MLPAGVGASAGADVGAGVAFVPGPDSEAGVSESGAAGAGKAPGGSAIEGVDDERRKRARGFEYALRKEMKLLLASDAGSGSFSSTGVPGAGDCGRIRARQNFL